ncbi:hypothetical protein VTJ49DRAFT_2841 [Mycothermus thermophilus]|uniref:Protein kinase domain-containing protein n=1 Tax=Humicola insolens TaxID=85995 RepID=A0ABR3V9H4_HUMIN
MNSVSRQALQRRVAWARTAIFSNGNRGQSSNLRCCEPRKIAARSVWTFGGKKLRPAQPRVRRSTNAGMSVRNGKPLPQPKSICGNTPFRRPDPFTWLPGATESCLDLAKVPSAAMELGSTTIHRVIHPTAAFAQETPSTAARTPAASGDVPWAESQLNPKNRIDSLELPQNPLWRVDGCTGLGTQYYVVPLFLPDVAPLRFDVFIPEEAVLSPVLRDLLDLDAAFHTKDATRLRRLGISSYIVRVLQVWVEQNGRDAYINLTRTLPFGSRIIFECLHFDVRQTRVSAVPTYYVERQLLGVTRLSEVLGVAPELIPKAIDIWSLNIVQESHDSVCLVRMRDERVGDQAEKLWVMKAMTSSTKYLFVELRNLLQMEPHAHVIGRPEYLVTKRCLFGGKMGVVGFLLPYHRVGSIRDRLPLMRIRDQLRLGEQLNWAIQLTSAMLHLRERCHMFYPDMRLDNVVLTDSREVVMVDFEQRGVWCEFAAPEVNAIDYVRILASEEPDDGNPPIPEKVSAEFAAMLDAVCPGWAELQAAHDYELPRPHGYPNYNIPWLALDETEQEAAMVYMLGRVLWCIFEGQSAPQTAVWQSYCHEPDIGFPTYRLAPPGLRDLIDRCTRGRRPELSSLIVRRDSKLVLRGREDSSADEVIRVAREWWQAEVGVAKEYLARRQRHKANGTWDGNHWGRPTLREVLEELEKFKEAHL